MYLHQMTRTTIPIATTRTSTTIVPTTPATKPRSRGDWRLGSLDESGTVTDPV